MPASTPGNPRVNHGRVLAAELFGTAVLVIGGPGTAILAPGVGLLGISVAFGLSLMIMAYVIGSVSGCHINPAVTLALLVSRKVTATHAVFAVIGQLIGGVAGAAIVFGIASGRDDFERGQFAANLWSGQYAGLGSAIVAEIVLTALLVVVVLAASTGGRIPAGMGGLVVGVTLTLVHLVAIPVDNTSVNPARSIATALFADPDTGALEQLWAFVLFPLVGAIVGVIIWLVIDDSSVEDTLLVEMPGVVATRDALDRVGDEAVDAVEDAVEDAVD
jgi:aquaporin Z